MILDWKNSAFLCLTLCLVLSSCDKTNETIVSPLGQNKEEAIKLEKKEGSLLLGDTEVYSKGNLPEVFRDSLDKKIRFIRNEKSEFPLKIKHYYDSLDGVIVCSMYQWDRYGISSDSLAIDQVLEADVNRQELYDEIFNEVGKELIKKYGDPNKGHGDLQKDSFKMLDIWSRKLIWDLDEEYLELNMYWVPKKGYRIFKVYVVHYAK